MFREDLHDAAGGERHILPIPGLQQQQQQQGDTQQAVPFSLSLLMKRQSASYNTPKRRLVRHGELGVAETCPCGYSPYPDRCQDTVS